MPTRLRYLPWLGEVAGGELVFHGHGVSGWEDEKVVEVDAEEGVGDGRCTTM